MLRQHRLHARGEIDERQTHDVLLVEPVEFVLAEDGIPTADAFEREGRDELVAREELLIGPWGPPEQREKIHHCLRKVAEPVILHDRRGPMALAQPFFVRTENQRHMRSEAAPVRKLRRAGPAWAYSRCDRPHE